MKRTLMLAAAMLALMSCAPAYPTYNPTSYVPPAWVSRNDYSAASGSSSCTIKKDGVPLTVIVVQAPSEPPYSEVTAIDADGLYPGREIYLNVDGQRFSGIERIGITPELLSVLRQGKTAHIEWSPWPSGGIRRGTASLQGFSTAYDNYCLTFLRERAQ